MSTQEFVERRSTGNDCCRITTYILATMAAATCGVASLLFVYDIKLPWHVDELKFAGFGASAAALLGFLLICLACRGIPVVESVIGTITFLLVTGAAGAATYGFFHNCTDSFTQCMKEQFDHGIDRNERLAYWESCHYAVLVGGWLAVVLWLLGSIMACCSINTGRRWVSSSYNFNNPVAV